MSEEQPIRKKRGALLMGDFLTDATFSRLWPYVILLSLFAGISIYSGHRVEVKVHNMEKLRHEMKELNSEYIDTRSRLMIESTRSKVVFRAAELDLKESKTPPHIIRVDKKSNRITEK